MSSDKCNSIMAEAMGLIDFSLLDVVSARQVPSEIPQYVQCTHHGLTFVLFCALFTAHMVASAIFL